MPDVGIRYLSFTPGAQSVSYRELPNVAQRVAEWGMPDEAALWGWGCFRRSAGSYREHIEAGFAPVRAHLAQSGGAIDEVILCAPCLNDCEEFVATTRALAWNRVPFGLGHVVTDTDCVNILAAMDLARARIAAGAREVLILSSEKVAKETWRFKRFSLFSDYSMALIVSADLAACAYEVLDVLIEQDPNPGSDTSSVLGRPLERTCASRLLGRNEMTRKDVGQFCYIHLYTPMYEMKGKDLGFRPAEMALQSIAEQGHCYGADPFVGMQTYFAARPAAAGGPAALLCASSKQCAGLALVRDRRAPGSTEHV